jgi:hypothetical protein
MVIQEVRLDTYLCNFFDENDNCNPQYIDHIKQDNREPGESTPLQTRTCGFRGFLGEAHRIYIIRGFLFRNRRLLIWP